jgi:hypothetical protein
MSWLFKPKLADPPKAPPPRPVMKAASKPPVPAQSKPPVKPGPEPPAQESRCFELRTYTVPEEYLADDSRSEFRDHTTELLKKHGMTIVGYWQPVTKPNSLIYILANKDGAVREAAWAAFNADSEWVKMSTEMHVDVEVDNVFTNASDFAPLT